MLTFRCLGFRPRASIRLLCGALALLLVASNTLAATGICIAKAPVSAASSSDAPCPQHVSGEQPAGQTAAHCPQDDPGAQARAADLPVAYFVAAPAFCGLLVMRSAEVESSIATSSHVPPEPLYARLSRLLL